MLLACVVVVVYGVRGVCVLVVVCGGGVCGRRQTPTQHIDEKQNVCDAVTRNTSRLVAGQRVFLQKKRRERHQTELCGNSRRGTKGTAIK